MTQPIDPGMVVRIAEIITADAARCGSVSGPVTEHGPAVSRCSLPPRHPGQKHQSPTGDTW